MGYLVLQLEDLQTLYNKMKVLRSLKSYSSFNFENKPFTKVVPINVIVDVLRTSGATYHSSSKHASSAVQHVSNECSITSICEIQATTKVRWPLQKNGREKVKNWNCIENGYKLSSSHSESFGLVIGKVLILFPGSDIYIAISNCIFSPQFLASFSKNCSKNGTKFLSKFLKICKKVLISPQISLKFQRNVFKISS